jgi:DNA-binding Xre family transcriptional regulator
MAEKKLTITKLAADSGMSRQQLSVILAKEKCTPVSAGRIAEGLSVAVTEIVKEE